jgi:Ca2+-binding RTX toxin-like protein
MVKFVAKKPVDTTALEELEFLVDPSSVSFDNRQKDGFVVKSGDVRAEVEGSGFRYVLQVPLPVGTIAKIEVFESGDLAYKLTDLNIKMSKLVGDDVEEAVLDMLEGDDKLKGSSGDDTLAGGDGDDQILGKAGDDTLYGQKGEDLLEGGLGFDTLDGGGGKDTYLFKDAPSTGIDDIAKFENGEIIQVKAKSFAGLTKGTLASDQFVEGTEAGDGNDRFVYDPDSGKLYFDADGAGGAAQTQFAQLQSNLSNFGADNLIVV